MTTLSITLLGGAILQRTHAPGDTSFIARDPWGVIGLAFFCASRFVFTTMAGKLNEFGYGPTHVLRWGVSTRYRKSCRQHGWRPWLPAAMWILFGIGVACMLFGVYKIHH